MYHHHKKKKSSQKPGHVNSEKLANFWKNGDRVPPTSAIVMPWLDSVCKYEVKNQT